MMRRANMGASIAGEGGNRKGLPESAGPRPCRVSGHGLPRGDIPRHHTAGTDHRAVADGDAGQDDSGPANPGIAADPHRTAELEPATPRGGVTRMVCGINLHGWTDLGALANRH